MANKSLPEASVVLVELGASWPAALIAGEARVARRVLAECEGEGPLAFAARAEAFLDQAFPAGMPLGEALVACNQRADETAEAARRAIAECVFSRLAPRGVLSFAGGEDASDRFRRRLFDLVADLGTVPAAEGRVRAFFGEDRHESGPSTSDGEPLAARARVA